MCILNNVHVIETEYEFHNLFIISFKFQAIPMILANFARYLNYTFSFQMKFVLLASLN